MENARNVKKLSQSQEFVKPLPMSDAGKNYEYFVKQACCHVRFACMFVSKLLLMDVAWSAPQGAHYHVSKAFMALRVRPTPTRFPTNIPLLSKCVWRPCGWFLLLFRYSAKSHISQEELHLPQAIVVGLHVYKTDFLTLTPDTTDTASVWAVAYHC